MFIRRYWQDFKITFEVISDSLPDKKIHITGNHEKLGNWDPGAVPLTHNANGIWVGHFTFPKNTRLQFKFTHGSWDTEAVNEGGKTFENFHLKVRGDQVWKTTISHWKKPPSPGGKEAEAETKPEERITGNVKFHRQMQGEGLLPRDIIVWLPPDYDMEPEKRFPVLYMHDGQNIFDAVTSYTGVDWQADETATRLISEGKMQGIIIVGIYNSDDRLDEYSLSPKGKLYRDFLVNTLKPFIDKEYRTLPGREHTATMGSSMGGLVSFLLVWYHSRVFSGAGCLSPSFVYHKSQAIKTLKKSDLPGEKVRIYMDCGGVGGERLLYKGCKKVARILRKKGLAAGKDFVFYYDRNANHSEGAWASRLWRPFLFLFGTAE